MLKTTRSSVASAFRVDDDEVVGGGGGAGAENCGNIVKRKLGSIILGNWLDCRGASYKGSRQVCRLCVFSGLGFKLLERTGINDHAVELVNGQQPPYGPIYSLRPVDPEGLY